MKSFWRVLPLAMALALAGCDDGRPTGARDAGSTGAATNPGDAGSPSGPAAAGDTGGAGQKASGSSCRNDGECASGYCECASACRSGCCRARPKEPVMCTMNCTDLVCSATD